MSIETWETSHPAFGGDTREASWLTQVRRDALARFHDLGFPGIKDEAWKYTSTRTFQKTAFAHVDAVEDDAVAALVDTRRIPHAAAELVFVDGRFAEGLSRLPDIAGVTLRPISQTFEGDDLAGALHGLAPWQDEAFVALNAAFVQDGVHLQVSRNTAVAGPIHVITVSSGQEAALAHLHHVVEAASGAEVTVVETFAGHPGVGLTNVVAEVKVGANASVDHLLTGFGAEEAHLVHTLQARLDRDARYRAHAAWLGGAITRSQVQITLAGEGAEGILDGLYVLDGHQHCDNRTIVDHAVPRCVSHEFYKGVLGGKSKGIFDGLIIVRQDAQKTDSTQNSRNLLLSDDADANAKPTLEIYADDVKCSHGSTVGALDTTQLAYLRTRGVPEEEARQILTAAFVADRVERIRDEALRARLAAEVDAKLTRVQEAT